MMIQETRDLCSKSEWALVDSSFFPMVETLSLSGLKSKLERARKLYQKTADQVDLQPSDSREPATRRKAELFAATVARFEATLSLVENIQGVEAPPKYKKMAEESATRKQSLFALTAYGDQQKRKSGARGIQAHVGAVNRRHQVTRDTKNR